MKSFGKILTFSAVMVMLVACGKKNESGRSNRVCAQYDASGRCNAYVQNVNSNYSVNGVSLNTVQAENPCIMNQGFLGQTTTFNRQTISTPITLPNNSIVPKNDMYVGVTSFGDVAAIIGNGTAQPLFVAYLCPRSVSGQGTLYPNITIGAYTNCAVKYITMANMVFPDGTQANFRAPVYGSSRGTKFSFCQ